MYAAAMGALTPATQAAIASSMPVCYTPQLDRCISDKSSDRGYPNCSAWRKAYDEDPTAIRGILNTIPFCPDPRRGRVWIAVAGVAGLLFGVIVCRT